MKALSKIAAGVSPSATLAVSALAKKMKAEGKDVIGFGAGEPDFATPDRISYAGVRAICDGKTRYTPAAGMIELRQAICDRVKADYGLEYEATQAVVASGAKHMVYIALAALVDPGDEVIVPAPYWVSYYEMVRLFGGVPVVVNVSEEQGFQLTPEQLEQAITDKTKAIILNNPSNPTGAVYPKEALKAVADVCVKHDLYIISDEIYDKLVYDGVPFTSVAALSDEIKAHTILINGVSKTYAMTGWRLGYACGPAPIIKIMTKIHQSAIMSAPTTSQYAAITALKECDGEIDRMRDEYNMRRRLVVRSFNDMGLTCFEPRGAFYAFPCIKSTGMSSQEFCTKLLEQKHVAIIPGDAFGASGEGYCRVSYAYSVEHLTEALKRIREFLVENNIYHGN